MYYTILQTTRFPNFAPVSVEPAYGLGEGGETLPVGDAFIGHGGATTKMAAANGHLLPVRMERPTEPRAADPRVIQESPIFVTFSCLGKVCNLFMHR